MPGSILKEGYGERWHSSREPLFQMQKYQYPEWLRLA